MSKKNIESVIRKNVPLADYTTIHLGGKAALFAECVTVDEILGCHEYADKRGIPVHVLGGGSNTIFADAGFDGLVLHVALQGIEFSEEGLSLIATVNSGEQWDPFVQQCIDRGVAGVECLSGIPGSTGATPIQNVGAYGQEVSDTIQVVHALDRITGMKVCFTCGECGFGYRQSRFKLIDAGRFIITQVVFRLRAQGRPEIRYPELQRQIAATTDLASLADGRPVLSAVRNAVLALRRKKSMVIDPSDPNTRSVGSFFTNPMITQERFRRIQERWSAAGNSDPIPAFPAGDNVKLSAAWLVEHAGFKKGYTKGGAGISSSHALALINKGGTTRDVLALADEINAGIRARFGITLEPEPVIVGL